MKSLRKTAILACVLLLPVPSPAQQTSNPPPQSERQPRPTAPNSGQARIVIPVNQVIIPVTVKDSSGHLVPDLQKDDFRIFEDGVEQRIGSFSADPYPLSIVVLLDNDLKSKDAEQVNGSLRAILAGLSSSDEAFVCRFDEYFHPGKGFVSDQDKLLTELKRTQLDSEPSVAPPGSTFNRATINGHSATSDAPTMGAATVNLKNQPTKALDDAVYNGAQLLKDRGRNRRKIILLVSDGANGKHANTNTYANAVKELLRYDVSVYSLGVSSAFFDRKFSRLVDYAHATGGDVYFAAKRSSMEELYSRVAEQARNQYTLAYSPVGTNRAVDYHTIEVRVKREGLTVDARQGYYVGAAPQ